MAFLIADIQGLELTAEDALFLAHPALAGIILFSRNFDSREQITALCQSIREIRPDFLITVDQEGGVVQRFKHDFFKLPPIAAIGDVYDHSTTQGLELAKAHAFIMASECLSVGVDFSYAPVLDIGNGKSDVIGTRAFHHNPTAIITLATAYIKSMHRAGMVVVGKHYPGHGNVTADSHFELPVNTASWSELMAEDVRPFKDLIRQGIDILMPGHVVYSAVDEKPASLSEKWLKDILKDRFDYKGLIISDDLSMKALDRYGDIRTRAQLALSAGCDLLLVCNNRQAAQDVADHVEHIPNALSEFANLQAKQRLAWDTLHQSHEWQSAVQVLTQLSGDYQ